MALSIGIALITAAPLWPPFSLADEPPTDRDGRELPPPPPRAIDLRTLEIPRFSQEAIRDEMMPSLQRAWPDLARALAAPPEEQCVAVPLPESLVTEPQPVLLSPAAPSDSNARPQAAAVWAMFSVVPPARLSLPYLAIVKKTLSEIRQREIPEVERDLVLLAADLWIRSVSANCGAELIADSLRDVGVRVERGYDADAYCGTLEEALARRADSTLWASRAFLILLDQGWVGACRSDFGENAYATDLFMAVIEHGERFLASHAESPIHDAVALRVALAHETAWSIDKWDSTYFLHESWNAEAERRRAIELYDEVARNTHVKDLRAAIDSRLRMLRRDQDTGCRVY
jgi:hypothetical protein